MICVDDVHERAAIIESHGVARAQAEAMALTEVGYASWKALGESLAAEIAHRLVALPPVVPAATRLLRDSSERFLKTPWWPQLVTLGWSDTEVFGVHPCAPLVRIDAWGLLPALVLSKLSAPKLIEVNAAVAIVRTATGSLLRWTRGAPGMDVAVPWWTSSALVGEARHAA